MSVSALDSEDAHNPPTESIHKHPVQDLIAIHHRVDEHIMITLEMISDVTWIVYPSANTPRDTPEETPGDHAYNTFERIIDRLEPTFTLPLTERLRSISAQATLAYVARIDEIFTTLLPRVGAPNALNLDSINSHNIAVKEWLEDSSISLPSLPPPPPHLPSIRLQARTSDSSLPPTAPGVVCPLESEMRSVFSSRGVKPRPSVLEDFLRWAITEEIQSPVHATVGSLQSVHHFREIKSPLHHEFAVASFGGGGAATSWVRMERAAIKRKVAIQNFSALLGGAPLRESVSFAKSKEELSSATGETVELATITLDANRPAVLLHEFAKQVLNASNAYPRYQLFSANCRYFARRVTLGLAQFYAGSAMAYVWRGLPSTYEKIQTELGGDPFGGKQLTTDESISVQAANSLELAATQVALGAASMGRIVCNHAWGQIQTIKKHGKRTYHLEPAMWMVYAAADKSYEQFSDVLEDVQKAHDLSVKHRKSSVECNMVYLESLDGLAEAYLRQRQPEKALLYIQEAVTARTEQYEQWGDPRSALNLAVTLSHQAHCWSLLPSYAMNAIIPITKAVELAQTAFYDRPDLVRIKLISILATQASILSQIGEFHRAFEASEQVVSRAREYFLWNRDPARLELALRLHEHSLHAAKAERWAEACLASDESVKLWMVLVALRAEFSFRTPGALMHLDRLADALIALVHHLRKAGDPRPALKTVEHAIRVLGNLNYRDSALYGKSFAEAVALQTDISNDIKELGTDDSSETSSITTMMKDVSLETEPISSFFS